MMAARTLDSPPSLLPLYARAAASMLPGASLLPFVPGGGKDVPDVDLTLAGVQLDPDAVAAYAQVCGFAPRDAVPVTYPHVLAFPLHMAAMADGRFPFGAVGLVHIENRIVQRRPVALGERVQIAVRATKLQPHPRGRAFSFITEASVAGETVWEEVSTFLRRGGGTSTTKADDERQGAGHKGAGTTEADRRDETGAAGGVDTAHRDGEAELQPTAEWSLGDDLGRRYAAVSGDRNPIHMHPLTAKAFGFPRAIAHGMWTKARCLAALEGELPDSFGVEVRFRKPILLPGKVSFASARRGEQIDFAVSDVKRGTPHLQGRIWPEKAEQDRVASEKTDQGRVSPKTKRRDPK